jgi:rhodanese-related sulfurtransferase
MAMMILRLWGYTDAYSIANGLNGWKVAGLPVVRH